MATAEDLKHLLKSGRSREIGETRRSLIGSCKNDSDSDIMSEFEHISLSPRSKRASRRTASRFARQRAPSAPSRRSRFARQRGPPDPLLASGPQDVTELPPVLSPCTGSFHKTPSLEKDAKTKSAASPTSAKFPSIANDAQASGLSMAEPSWAPSVVKMLAQAMPAPEHAKDIGSPSRQPSLPGSSRSDDTADPGMLSNSGTSQSPSTRMHPRIRAPHFRADDMSARPGRSSFAQSALAALRTSTEHCVRSTRPESHDSSDDEGHVTAMTDSSDARHKGQHHVVGSMTTDASGSMDGSPKLASTVSAPPARSSGAVKQAFVRKTYRSEWPLSSSRHDSMCVPSTSAPAGICNRPLVSESLQAALSKRAFGIGTLRESLLEVANEGAPAKDADPKFDAMALALPATSSMGIFAPSMRGFTSRETF